MAGLFELRHSRVDEHAGITGLQIALAETLRERGRWEAALRLYFEPQFAHRRPFVDGLSSLMREQDDAELAVALAAEWLTRYPDMPFEPEAELIDRLVRSGKRETLRAVGRQRSADESLSDERRRNWHAIAFIEDFEAAQPRLQALGRMEGELLWHIRARLGNDGRNERTRDLDVPQLDWLIETFRGLFPNQHRPDGLTRGDTNGWDAAEFLTSLIRRLGSQTSDAAIAAMSRLRDGPLDGYTAGLRAVAAEQRRNRVEADYRAPAFAYVVSAIGDAPPTTRRQLQAVVLEELRIVQAKLRGSDVDWYADFIDDAGRPRIEDHCRNAVLKMLRPMPFDIQALPEGHIADDKRCDIICLLGNLMVPIEVKGQWNVDLWSAADHQLASLYINDWRAEVGIYLVL